MAKIPAKTVIRLLDSMAFMNSQHGVAFNGMITLNFKDIGVSTEKDSVRALTKLNEAVADRIYRHGQRFGPGLVLPHFFIYAHEHVETHGHHVHELIVLPQGLEADFDPWLQRWAMRNYGTSDDSRAIRYGGRLYKDDRARADQQRRLSSYILKSSDNAAIHARDGGATTLHAVLGIDVPNRAYCAKVSRVAGSSQNLAKRAQYDVGFELPDLIEDAMTDVHLREFHRRNDADDLHRQLRSIDF